MVLRIVQKKEAKRAKIVNWMFHPMWWIASDRLLPHACMLLLKHRQLVASMYKGISH